MLEHNVKKNKIKDFVKKNITCIAKCTRLIKKKNCRNKKEKNKNVGI